VRKTLPQLLTWSDLPDVRLRLVDWPDTELMREWKNANKAFFFHSQDITPEQQRTWFAGYLERPDDHDFAVEERVEGSKDSAWETVGLLGCRLVDQSVLGDTVDIYNVMRGRRTVRNLVSMGEMIRRLCGEIAARYPQPISCKVLSGNPAVAWYLQNGFVRQGQAPDHVVLRYQPPGGGK
jgi:hypothetical protein